MYFTFSQQLLNAFSAAFRELSCYMSTIWIQFVDMLTHGNDMQMGSVVQS